MRFCTKCCFSSALLLAAALFSLCAGASGFGWADPVILVHIRLPRTVAPILSGAALACAGCLIQGVLHNPLAGPSVIGVNAGAGFATLLLSWLFPNLAAMLPAAAFAGAMGACLILLALSRRGSALTVVLAGVALSAILSAASDLITTLAPEVTLGLTSFRVGGFSGVSADRLALAACYILPGLLLALFMAGRLDVLTLGDEVAQSVGLNVRWTRVILLLLAALLCGAAVSFSGLIGFVGLIIPHVIRRFVGGEHRRLLPMSMLSGAVLMLVCDTIARTAFAPYELPVGILLSLAGGPFFLWLLMRRRAA